MTLARHEFSAKEIGGWFARNHMPPVCRSVPPLNWATQSLLLESHLCTGNEKLRKYWHRYFEGNQGLVCTSVPRCNPGLVNAQSNTLGSLTPASLMYRTDIVQIYVIDSSDGSNLAAQIAALVEVLADERLTNSPLLVLANKQDLAAAMDPAEVCT